MASAHGGNLGFNDPPCNHAPGGLIPNPEAPMFDFGPARSKVAMQFTRCRNCMATMICVAPTGTPPHRDAWKPLNLVLNALDRSGTRIT